MFFFVSNLVMPARMPNVCITGRVFKTVYGENSTRDSEVSRIKPITVWFLHTKVLRSCLKDDDHMSLTHAEYFNVVDTTDHHGSNRY